MSIEYIIINENLIKEVLAGKPAAQIRLVELSEKYIYGALHTFQGLSGNEIDDLFQTVYLKLFEDDMRRIRIWNQKAKFTTYLYRIVINLVKDYLGSAHLKNQEKRITSDENDPVMNVPDSGASVDENLDPVALKYCLNQLKSTERQIVELYYYQDLKEREIAQLLNKPLNTISSLKNRTLKKLKILLEELDNNSVN